MGVPDAMDGHQMNAVTPVSAIHLPPDADEIDARYGYLPTQDLLNGLCREAFPGRIAIVSSFGTESAVLLDLVARANPDTPVIFLNTGKLFGETLRYRDQLVARLGLTDIRVVQPRPAALAKEDPDGRLWAKDPDRCCALRKTLPLQAALKGFDAWISGQKRFQAASRGSVPLVETDDAGRIKVNPLAQWSRADIEDAFAATGLPRHPLEAEGFPSIGCVPCTSRVAAGEDPRAGRWRGLAKTECGIHRSPAWQAMQQQAAE